jgi:hypothetical protein
LQNLLNFMKLLISLFFVLTATGAVAQLKPQSENIFIVTTDGFRWQEIFSGADSVLINSTKYTSDTLLTKLQYWDTDANERRKKLLPFFWNVLAAHGQIMGNRSYGNKVDVSNLYKFSYPGYNEILTGYSDSLIYSNKEMVNKNTNILEYLNENEKYKGKVVAFSSWSAFPYILGKQRNELPVFSGYETLPDTSNNSTLQMINEVQNKIVVEKKATRYDAITFLAAKEYIKQHQPKVVFISLGETDDSAHGSRYDNYLQEAAQVDKMIADLWYFIQTSPAYKNNTTLLITTDHGRGYKTNQWNKHSFLVKGSGEAWLAVIGPGIKPLGEIKEPRQLFQKQIANSIAALLGVPFNTEHPVAKGINFNN